MFLLYGTPLPLSLLDVEQESDDSWKGGGCNRNLSEFSLESARRQHKVSIRGPSCGAARLSKPSDRAPLRSGDSSNLRQMLLGTMTMGALSHLLFLPN